ncbi:unnamed protein product [Allacma fusca]|uniref:C2H2-type domain-containing protein n=1 Tax=Allacma fusca TaxID=39272 RepID=A0A8J2KSQ4_9HEXA|nr:unnamed protein product [Allacma fusca]
MLVLKLGDSSDPNANLLMQKPASKRRRKEKNMYKECIEPCSITDINIVWPTWVSSPEHFSVLKVMSTIAGMFYIRSGTPGQDTPPSGCSVAESENNLSEDDNTSCSASEMGCDLTVAPSKESSLSSRKNKRKNFMPRNIMEYAGSDEEEDNNAAVQRNRLNHHHRRNNNNIRMVDADEEENDNTENDNDMDIDCGDQEDGDLEDDVDRPLDLSEVQNDSKFLWRKPESLINPLLSINHNNNSISNSNNNSQSSLHSPHLGNSFVFAPMAMDLRLSNSRHNSSHAEELFEDRSNDLMISSTSSSNASNHHGMPAAGGGTALTDFAESTMKELLGLYGIAENLRQAGKPSPEIPGIQRNLESPGQPTKMMLPENMARFLAAMQESVTAAQSGSVHPGGIGSNQNCNNNNNNGSNSGSPSSLNLNVNPLSFASINNLVQQHQVSSGSANKSQMNSKSPSSRGLTSFPVIREGLLGKGSGPVDYTRYVRRYANSSECGYQQCRELNYREHFHCLDCGEGTRVFVKKEEMIRHFKWHKKRDESLQHGFMRYSPMDDCSDRFRNCTHNRKQTHYHCLQDGCEKVYISTSDVQMHANYHRKDSAIIQEGFQRFRAAEDCGADHCSFRHQRTTHFHCRRTSCSYTFKNKADMEKHKSYHIKDEQLNRDGFKKFMKHEACHYSNCRFSRVCNHIHCIREGCNYVLHSSGQLYSHKVSSCLRAVEPAG